MNSLVSHSRHPEPVAELDRLGDEIADLSAHLEAATARLLDLIREFDARGGWNTGFRSCADWLSWRVGLDLGAARERVRVARALGTLPVLAQALARGELSYAKVRALTRVATPETEARLLNVGRAGTAAHVERSCGARGPPGRGPGDRPPACQPRTARSPGRGRHGRAARAADPRGGGAAPPRWTRRDSSCIRKPDARRRPCVQAIRRRSLQPWPSSGPTHSSCLPRLPSITGSIRARQGSGIRSSSTSTPPPWRTRISPASPSSRAARAFTRKRRGASPATPAGSSCGTTGRTPPGSRGPDADHPRALRRALHHRDRTCRFPGSGLPFGQGHHVRHWAQGGPTTLSNLALLCRRHHRAVHEEGYQIDRQPDGSFRFRRPDGRPLPEVPPPAAVPANPVQALRA